MSTFQNLTPLWWILLLGEMKRNLIGWEGGERSEIVIVKLSAKVYAP